MKDWTERQEEIMDQAMRLIAERGIQGLTVRNLAKRIGVSEPALYRHFESKTDVLVGILDRFDRSSEGILRMLSDADCSCFETLEVFLVNTLSLLQERPEVTAVIFAEEIFQNEPRLSEKVADIMRRRQESLNALIAGGQDCGVIRGDVPADGLGLLFLGSLRLLVKRWRMADYGFDLIEEGRALLDVHRALLIHEK